MVLSSSLFAFNEPFPGHMWCIASASHQGEEEKRWDTSLLLLQSIKFLHSLKVPPVCYYHCARGWTLRAEKQTRVAHLLGVTPQQGWLLSSIDCGGFKFWLCMQRETDPHRLSSWWPLPYPACPCLLWLWLCLGMPRTILWSPGFLVISGSLWIWISEKYSCLTRAHYLYLDGSFTLLMPPRPRQLVTFMVFAANQESLGL